MARRKMPFSSPVGIRRRRASRASAASRRRSGSPAASPAETNVNSAQGRKRKRCRRAPSRRARSSSGLSQRSVLLTAMTMPVEASCARPAMCVSCAVTPWEPSMRRTATSQRASAAVARSTEWRSTPWPRLPGRLMPAVSMRVKAPSGASRSVSMASRVVPATLLTMTRSSPMRAFTSVDLPTLGRPTMATRTRSCSTRGWVSGRRPTTSSRRRPTFRSWRAETGRGGPKPRAPASAAAITSRDSLSALVATRMAGVWPRRTASATS